MLDELLAKLGMDYKDLTSAEIDTLNEWMGKVQQKSITVDGIKDIVIRMKDAVERELVLEPEFLYILFFKFLNRKQIYLKARLHNYLLLIDFLSGPDRAKEALDKAIAALVRKK